MSDRPEAPHKQSKVEQKAVSDINARDVTIRDIVQQVVQIFPPWSQVRLTKPEHELPFRKILLNKVKRHWLSDQSSEEMIELRLQKNFDCDAENNERVHEFTTVADIFKGWETGQSLLILGEPGIGKTTALLQLAQNFVNRAQEDGEDNLIKKLPVIFDLSSWADERQSIDKWLIKELKTKYLISNERLRKTWVTDQQMVLLLDGLNEVKEQYRSACVEKINEFRENYGQHEIIVCSRTQAYKNLDKRLTIRDTVCVQPLTSEQINKYLDRREENLNLKQLLETDSVLQELAKTPLMLSIMSKHLSIENLPKTGLLEERRSKIFNTYINEMFKRVQRQKREQARQEGRKYKEEEDKYQEKNVRTWLTWLADKMSKTVFLIEEIQPSCSWLSQEEKKTYSKIIIWYYGILFGFLFGTAYGTILHYYLVHLSPDTEQTVLEGIFVGIIQGICLGPIAAIFLKSDKLEIETYAKVEFFWGRYLNNFLKNTPIGIGIGIGIFLICWGIMPTILHYKLDEAIITGLIAGPFFAIVIVISRATGDSFVENSALQDIPVKPNQGIWDSLSHALAIAIVITVSIGIIHTIFILIIGQTDLIIFILGLCVAVLSALVAILVHRSGRNCTLHYALRIVLERKNHIPHNYADFLEYATKLTFMKRIGGGYKFDHDLFQKHVASLPLNQGDGNDSINILS